MRDKNKQGKDAGDLPDKDPVVKHYTPVSQSRRDFLQGTGATVVATAAVTALGIPRASAQQAAAGNAPRTAISLTVNGTRHSVEVEDRWTLVELLRDELDLTGTKIGCNRSECGACTVLMDGEPVYSCSQLAVWADGKSVQTVEGLARNGQLSPVQQAFVENNGAQCGFCTPGQLMAATALLSNNPSPNPDEVKEALVGNLCRCSNYNAIVEAVVAAGEGQGGVA
jgi:aerobic-type carbon monoxide dehydrogenase small subunit (CoxS/CutS family)|tara:strand:+ start:503 stop:1177 length:675 start_codon:yes stop_codon:yes gene_type:complete